MTDTPLVSDTAIGAFHVTTLVTGAAWRENCYLVRHIGSGELALIDPGGNERQIASLVQLHGGALRYILLTHAHHDHVGAVAGLARQFHVPCRLHRNDVRLLRHAPMYAWRFAHVRIEVPVPYLMHADPPGLLLGGQPIEVLHTPGHTPGSVCYSLGKVVFTGDTLLFQHVGRVDLPGGDEEQIKASVAGLMRLLPRKTRLLAGHGRPWSIEEAQVWWDSAVGRLPQYSEPSARQVMRGEEQRHE